MTVPILIGEPGLYYGGIVTPDGFRFIFSSKLPDDYIAYVHVPYSVHAKDLGAFVNKVYPGAKYSFSEFILNHSLTLVRYTSIDKLKDMILNAKGYNCSILDLVGANFVKITPENVHVYDVYGTVVYCTGLGIGITVNDVADVKLYPACYEKSSLITGFGIKDGKIYYKGKPVANGTDLNALYNANPDVMLSYENLLQILCLMAKKNA